MSITITSLKAWGLAASILASHGQRHLSDAVLTGMATAAIERPLVNNDDGTRTMMAYEVALAWHEGSNSDGQPHGSNDGGNSFCWAQINLPNNQHTWDGWSGKDLVEDPLKCAKAAALIIKYSASHGPVDCPLCMYARGPRGLPGQPAHVDAARLSATRVELAKRLLREVPWVELSDPAQD